jgi:hypothetical protein
MSPTYHQFAQARLGRSRPVRVAAGAPLPVDVTWLGADRVPVPCMTPRIPDSDLAIWSRQLVDAGDDRVAGLLADSGAVLLRGFDVGDRAHFAAAVPALVGYGLEPYTFRSTPRHHLGELVYTSTEYPAGEHIALHGENSYSNRWPRYLALRCRTAATDGGATSLARADHVWAALPDEVRGRFVERGITYLRCFGDDLGLTWQETFQTDDRERVTRECEELSVGARWDAGVLHTSHDAPAWVEHPDHGPVWFNQAHLFHVSNLGPEVENVLRAQYDPRDLPRHSTFADGTEIEAGDLAAVRAVLDDLAWDLTWQADDVLLLDNMLVAHGRRPFHGPRRVEVVMSGVVRRHGPDPTTVAGMEEP